MTEAADIFIIGGGINGCGIAADAAGRGLKVILAEQNDLASGTSSASTKLIHGGLRYLEYFEFRLVHEALTEREVLLNAAPHIIKPMRFLLPQKGLRPAWFLRLGLFIYDHLGGRKILPPTKTVSLRNEPFSGVLEPGYNKAYEYSDCWVDDARLVLLNAMVARDHGAEVLTRHKCVNAVREDGLWHVRLQDQFNNQEKLIKAKVIVNAAGPWVDQVLSDVFLHHDRKMIRLVKGSHIIIKKLYDHDRAYVFQGKQGRIIFVIPYQKNFTLIGTTDQDFKGDLSDIHIDQSEIEYLCELANDYFQKDISPEDVISHYAGVRPLYDDGASKAQAATRDFVLNLDKKNALLNIIGGKITTYRALAEKSLDQLKHFFPDMPGHWTAGSALPGGDFKFADYDQKYQKFCVDYPFLKPEMAARLFRSYGTLVWTVLDNVKSVEDLGQYFGGSLYEKEVDYLIRSEWVKTADDLLWRRSKLGLHMSDKEIKSLKNWFKEI
ncbi:MAG: glycerol-3-phosphate dehydrogenase [Kordiimonadaceae bacterium]|nr:glycerol-3-phosphate dehydrogenase [Kordiimonadaceae bacterium]